MSGRVWERIFSGIGVLQHNDLGAYGAPMASPRQPPDPPVETPSTEATSIDDGHVRDILQSGLFDVAFYAEQSGQASETTTCITHYLTEGAPRGLRPNRLFDPRAYLLTHKDVADAGMNPFLHYVRYGVDEGRHVVVPDDVFSELQLLPGPTLAKRRVLSQAIALGFDRTRPLTRFETVAVYASSFGNFFFRQIADRIASGFRASGHRVYRLDQNSQRPEDVTLDFVVAPHEFFLLGAGRCWRDRLDLARSVVFNTEQPGTPWYFRALRNAAGAGTVVDLSPHSAAFLPGLGFPKSGFLPLGPVAEDTKPADESLREPVSGLEDVSLRHAADSRPIPWADRPIDVLFLGTLTPRRSEALARLAATLAPYRCFIHAPTAFGNPLRAVKGQIHERHSRELVAQAKILLNIHRGEFPYFEWHRVVMLGAEQGAVVVSEPSLPVPGIHPGLHYVSASLGEMPGAIDHLLGEDGAELADRMTGQCRADLAEHLELGVELRALTFLHRHGDPSHA